MVKDMILIDREALLIELRTVFDERTADTLLNVLDRVAEQVHAAGVTREDFSELKQIVADVAKEQRKLVEEVQKIAEEQRKIAEEQRKLAKAQRQTEECLVRLEQAVAELVEVQKQHEKRLGKIEDDVGKLKGYALESRYRDRTPSYFGRWLRRSRVVDLNDLWDVLDMHLSAKELEEIAAIDLVVKGKLKHQPEAEEVFLTVEISSVMDKNDVLRTRQRAELLQRAGYRAIPVVAGEKITEGAEIEAGEQGVAILQDGCSLLWDEALARWVSDQFERK